MKAEMLRLLHEGHLGTEKIKFLDIGIVGRTSQMIDVEIAISDNRAA